MQNKDKTTKSALPFPNVVYSHTPGNTVPICRVQSKCRYRRRREETPQTPTVKVTNAISVHTIFVSSALGVNRALALDMGFGTALSQKLQTPLGKIDDLAFIVLLRLILVSLDLLVRDLFDHVNNVV